MELSSQETSCASDLEDPAWWVASASDHPGDDTGPSWDAATGQLQGVPCRQNTLEGRPDESWDTNMKFCSLDVSVNMKSLAASFLKKIWEMLSSQSFESIWWGNNGNCAVIGGKLFRK
ncbi:HSFX1 protein, partial [Erythrocercus mccallii]|nr:HSFX1 protein [Erythrocercus mccallii]